MTYALNMKLRSDRRFQFRSSQRCYKVFCATNILKNLVKEPTCFKMWKIQVALILSRQAYPKSSSPTHEPKIFNYRNYKKFNNRNFRNDSLEISKKIFTT